MNFRGTCRERVGEQRGREQRPSGVDNGEPISDRVGGTGERGGVDNGEPIRDRVGGTGERDGVDTSDSIKPDNKKLDATVMLRLLPRCGDGYLCACGVRGDNLDQRCERSYRPWGHDGLNERVHTTHE